MLESEDEWPCDATQEDINKAVVALQQVANERAKKGEASEIETTPVNFLFEEFVERLSFVGYASNDSMLLDGAIAVVASKRLANEIVAVGLRHECSTFYFPARLRHRLNQEVDNLSYTGMCFTLVVGTAPKDWFERMPEFDGF